MVEKIGTIKNPLTVIAIFAAIAEISGTAVLPFIGNEHQAIYVWFLMLFPALLVVLFFVTLNFNYSVLYAPSDFQDEANFLKMFKKATAQEESLKFKEELAQNVSVVQQVARGGQVMRDEAQIQPENTYPKIASDRDIKARYFLAEELVLKKLQKDLNLDLQKNMSFAFGNKKVLFDGIAVRGNRVDAIEVKYIGSGRLNKANLKQTLVHLQEVYSYSNISKLKIKITLAIVSDSIDDKQIVIQNRIQNIVQDFSFPLDVRFYYLDELEHEFGLS